MMSLEEHVSEEKTQRDVLLAWEHMCARDIAQFKRTWLVPTLPKTYLDACEAVIDHLRDGKAERRHRYNSPSTSGRILTEPDCSHMVPKALAGLTVQARPQEPRQQQPIVATPQQIANDTITSHDQWWLQVQLQCEHSFATMGVSVDEARDVAQRVLGHRRVI